MINDHERMATLVSRFAARDLSGPELEEANRHIGECAECRALADVAALLRDELASTTAGLPAHPEALLLARYATDLHGMPAGAQSFVEEHLAACAACADAVRLARGTVSVAESARSPVSDRMTEAAVASSPGNGITGPERDSLWARLSVSLLRPELALAYLVLLAIVLPLVLRGAANPVDPQGEAGSLALLPATVVLDPVDVLRGDETEPTPDGQIEVRLGDATNLLLALRTDLDPLDWEGGSGALELTVETDSPLLSQPLAPSAVDDLGRVHVVIPSQLLELDATHRLVIKDPGLEGPPLFEARFRPIR